MNPQNCPLCNPSNEEVVVSKPLYRVILVDDKKYPAYFRVIWEDHVKEMSDLSSEERRELWDVLEKVEETMISMLHPKKINLAQFGNMVPHLHWHLIARWEDDAAFPDSIWSPAVRETDEDVIKARRQKALACAEKLKEVLT